MSEITTRITNAEDPQVNNEYLLEMYQNLILEEKNVKSLFGYMKNQNDINEKMRAMLVDWLIDVHFKFKLKANTLFLTIWLVDKYLSLKKIKRNKLQLIGVTCMLISCKYEEIYSPEVFDFIYITENSYEKKDIIDQEFYLGKYLLEMFLLDYRSLKYKPSEIANTVCFIIVNHRRNNDITYLNESANDFIYNYTNNEMMYKDCCRDISFLLEYLDSTQLVSVKKKYLTKACHKVGRLKKIFTMN